MSADTGIFGHASSGPDLRAFLAQVEEREGLARVSREVSQVHEASAVVKRLEAKDGRAVWFDRVADSPMPVVMGLYGAKERIALALGLPGAAPPEVISAFHERLRDDVSPEPVSDGPVQAVRHPQPSLDSLPIGIHAAKDGGRYITSGVLLARDPAGGAINAGIYRLMVQGETRFSVSVDPGHDLGKIIAWGREAGEPVDFAVVIGAHPTLSLASQAKVPLTRDSFHVMGALLGEPVELVACDTVDLQVPANAEIVLEGHLLPATNAQEGPFGEFHYYYGSDPRATLAEVTAISHRQDAIFADIHPTHADHRCLWLHPGRETSLLERVRAAVPSVTMTHIPLAGAGMVALLSIAKEHPGDPRRALVVALGFDVFIKHALIVDDDVDIYDPSAVLWALATRFQPDRDLLVISNVRGYAEDPSTYALDPNDQIGGLTSKVGYDLTVPVGGYPAPADILPEAYQDLDTDDYVENPLPRPNSTSEGGLGAVAR